MQATEGGKGGISKRARERASEVVAEVVKRGKKYIFMTQALLAETLRTTRKILETGKSLLLTIERVPRWTLLVRVQV